MMKLSGSKVRTAFYCSRCGAEHSKWQGQCRECGAWNTLIEERIARKKTGHSTAAAPVVQLAEITTGLSQGYVSGMAEFDRVLGGKLLPGMAVLIAGEPGIGKSTLLLQVAEGYARQGMAVLYVTGEESLPQIKQRAGRLGVAGDGIDIVNDTSLQSIASVIQAGSYAVALIDSIQTVSSSQFDSPPGTVGQVREAAHVLVSLAKEKNTALFLVGHITKEGMVAGPKVLEHVVDTVISFEGDSSHLYRMLRTSKNRFGSILEIGLFEMTSRGLAEVSNPSSLFLNAYNGSGTVVAGLCEGNRSLMVEVQALVTAASYGTAQRVAGGVDGKKLALLLAILEKRGDYPMATHDVFISVAGGLRISEPALDLPVLVAIVSSLRDKVVSGDTVLIGEVGLSGEVRGVTNIDQRVHEAARLGFARVILPESNRSQVSAEGIDLVGARDMQTALDTAFG